ncbi:MAG: NAD-dependent epimerase/dehydratase family protein [Bacteriovorax sp.]|jgi:nucleoside-diphosphate-sugar epimerase
MEVPTKKETIIITGSNGFIGNAITKNLCQKFNVIGFDREFPKTSEAAANYAVDIASAESISKALSKVMEKFGNKIASVIHLAAYYSFAEQESPEYDKITVKGTEKLLQLLKAYEVEQFIFSSTMLVYKPVELGQRINESSPVEPSWAYPKSKVEAEKILKREHGSIPLVNLRIAGVYDDRCHSIPISNQIMRIYERHFSGRLYPGDDSKGQSFLHLDDLLDAIDKLIEKRKIIPPEVDILLGEPKAISYAELQNQVSMLIHGRHWNSMKIPLWFAKTGSWLQHHTPLIRKPFIMPWMIDFTNDHYELDVTQAKNLLGWIPKHELRATIPSMIEVLKKNPLQFYSENKLKEPSEIARLLGRMPGDILGFEVPSEIYHSQLNTLNLMNILWGAWLILDSFTRPISPAMMTSSFISGFLVMILSTLALLFLWQWPRWLSAIVGFWILFAPLAFWTTSAADYSNANVIGFLVILCGAYRPGKQYYSVPTVLDRPRDWDYNPSSWRQRIPIVTLAFFGFFIARYMAAFQLGHIDSVWDPFFGGQTETILLSDVSKAFPISDAGLGAFSYLLDAASGLIGDRHRWRTMPWMVILFGLMIIPPGVTSIALVILQPVAVNAWCALCLLTAVIMLLMVSPALDEVVACVQFLRASHKEGKPFWRTFLHGEVITHEEISAVPSQVPFGEVGQYIPNKIVPSISMALIGSIILSTSLMFLPALLNIEKPASNLLYFSAALILTFSIIALSEIARPLRFLNIVLGFILAIGVWWPAGIETEASWIVTLISLSITALNLPKGKFRHHFGSYDHLARWSPVKKALQ